MKYSIVRRTFAGAAILIGMTGFIRSERSGPETAAEPCAQCGAMTDGGHMNNPLHRQMMMVSLLPEMQAELGLSSHQVVELRGLKQDLLAKSRDISGQTAARRKELDLLLSGDTSRTRAVKALFEKIADLRAQLQYAGFETANKMKAVLNDAQRAKVTAMKPADLHRLMMSRVHTGEMDQMMQLMSAGDGMHMDGGHDMDHGGGMLPDSRGETPREAPANAPQHSH